MPIGKALKALALLVVLVAVLVVFISPAVDLDYSALQGKQRAQMVFALICYWGTLLLTLCATIGFTVGGRAAGGVLPSPEAPIFSLALLC